MSNNSLIKYTSKLRTSLVVFSCSKNQHDDLLHVSPVSRLSSVSEITRVFVDILFKSNSRFSYLRFDKEVHVDPC